MSETKKAPQQTREGVEQVRAATQDAVDSSVRTSKEAVSRAEDVFNRTADEARKIGAGAADTMARSAEAMVDLTERAAEQGRTVVSLGLGTAAGVNSRVAEAGYGRGQRVLESTARVLDIYREAGESTAEKVRALFVSGQQFGRGLQQMQVAYLQLLDRTMQQATRKPQDLLRAASFEEFAKIQRDLYIDAVNFAFEASSTFLQMAGRVAQEAVPTAQARTQLVRP